MEILILILVIVLGICIAYITELMKRMCDRANWLQEQFSNFKDYNDKEYVQFNKEFAEIMKQVNDLRSQLKSLEDKVKKDEDCLYDEAYGLRSRLNAIDCRVKENKNYLCKNLYEIDSRFDVLDSMINNLRDMYGELSSTIDEYKKTLNAIRTEMSNKEEKEENE